MRNNGGFILIKIDKRFEDIASSDFDVSLFKEIYEKKILKPLLLESKNGYLLFNESYQNNGVSYSFANVIVLDDMTIDGYTQCEIQYTYSVNTLTFTYTIV